MKNNIEVPYWQWQSDQDPFKQSNRVKWTWQTYPSHLCVTLEKAYSSNQKIVDIGDYEVDLNKWFQIHKEDRSRMRRVRREVHNPNLSRLQIDLPTPSTVGGNQRTMNQPFGNVEHFLDFLIKRAQETYDLYQDLKKLPLSAKESEFKDIVSKVVDCIQRAAEERDKDIDDKDRKQIAKAQEIIAFIKNHSRTLEEFLQTILRIYTMQSFLCYWLNEILRNHRWEEVNILVPYLVCLIYTFKHSAYVIKPEERLINVRRQKLSLYRGNILTNEQFSQYRSRIGQYFSWNCVTSTSRIYDIAVEFMDRSLKTAQQQEEAKEGVLFIIETDFDSIKNWKGVIDVSKISQFPTEQEVILAPGTVFELMKIKQKKKGYYHEIHLRIEGKLDDVRESVTFVGRSQARSISKELTEIKNLPSYDSLNLLQCLVGNTWTQNLKISYSRIEESLMERIEKIRGTTSLNKQDIELKYNTIRVSCLSVLAYYFSPENLEDILLKNNIVFEKSEKMKHFSKESDWKMKSLSLGETTFGKYLNNNEFEDLCESLKKETCLTIIGLSIKNLDITEAQLNNLWKSIKHLTLLEHFSLTLNSSKSCQGKGFGTVLENPLFELGDLLANYACLQHLELSFSSYQNLSDEDLSFLNKVFTSLPKLQHLSLDFTSCTKLTDNLLINCETPGKSLLALKFLFLNFGGCNNLSDQSLNRLRKIIQASPSLEYLALDFGGCNQISNFGLYYLAKALTNLQSLEYLSLDFWYCRKISDEGLHILSEKLEFLKSLRNLSLAFGGCDRISDQGLRHIQTILPNLVSLKDLPLDFKGCERLSDEYFENLKSTLSISQNQFSLFLNQRPHRDFDLRPIPKYLSLNKDYFRHRMIFLIILVLALGFKIFDYYLIHVILAFIPCLSMTLFSSESIQNAKVEIRRLVSEYFSFIVEAEEFIVGKMSRVAKISQVPNDKDQRQSFWATFVVLGFCFGVWKCNLSFYFFTFIGLSSPMTKFAWHLLKKIFLLLSMAFDVIWMKELDQYLIEKINQSVEYLRKKFGLHIFQDAVDKYQHYLTRISDFVEPVQKCFGSKQNKKFD